MKTKVIFSSRAARDLDAVVERSDRPFDKVFVLTDETTRRLCRPLMEDSAALRTAADITIGSTDAHKTLQTLADVWKALGDGGASRRSLLVCLGGGMVTDLGGFAAATFKRGIAFINIPTTLLSMVDAAVGGKTGINFNGLKNEVGAFCDSRAVIVDTDFLRTLDAANLRSGYAEMLKHALLSDESMWAAHLRFDLSQPDYGCLRDMVAQSIAVKERIVAADPHEQGLRKALNLGHTAGHALESLALAEDRPVLHGYAVAWGLICELYLSAASLGFPEDRLRQTTAFIREHYGPFAFECRHYEQLYTYMLHDKKNAGGVINLTLLADIREVRLDCHVQKELIFEAFDFLREG